MATTERLKFSIRKDDLVQIISGREKGKTGKVLHVDRADGRVTVEKLNMVKKHMKASQKNPQGGILEKELPVHYSNVLLMCSKCNRGVRHAHKLEAAKAEKGKKAKGAGKAPASEKSMAKVRVCKRCGEQLVYA